MLGSELQGGIDGGQEHRIGQGREEERWERRGRMMEPYLAREVREEEVLILVQDGEGGGQVVVLHGGGVIVQELHAGERGG